MLKVDSRSGLLSLANYPKPSLLGFCSEFSQIQRSKPDLLFSEFSGFYILFNLQLSRFFVVVYLSGNSFIIPQLQLFVNNFFNFIFLLYRFKFILSMSCLRQLIYISMYYLFCQHFFQLFFILSQKMFYQFSCLLVSHISSRAAARLGA